MIERTQESAITGMKHRVMTGIRKLLRSNRHRLSYDDISKMVGKKGIGYLIDLNERLKDGRKISSIDIGSIVKAVQYANLVIYPVTTEPKSYSEPKGNVGFKVLDQRGKIFYFEESQVEEGSNAFEELSHTFLSQRNFSLARRYGMADPEKQIFGDRNKYLKVA